MKVNHVTNQNQISHKGYVKLVGPTGKTITANARDISRVSSECIGYSVQVEKANRRINNYYEHFIEVAKVVFTNSQHFIVNAIDSDVLNAIAKAKSLPDDKGLTIGNPQYPLIANLGRHRVVASKDKERLNLFEGCTKEQLEKFTNTVDVVSHFDLGNNANLAKDLEDEGMPGPYLEKVVTQYVTSNSNPTPQKQGISLGEAYLHDDET